MWRIDFGEMTMRYGGPDDGCVSRRVWRGVEKTMSYVLGDELPDVSPYKHGYKFDLVWCDKEQQYEVKSAQSGQFVLRRGQHEQVIEEGVKYVFCEVERVGDYEWQFSEYAVVEPEGVPVSEWYTHPERGYEYAYVPVGDVLGERDYTEERWSRAE